MTRAFPEITLPPAKKSEKREKPTMNERELKIRVAIRKNLPRLDNCVKYDIILYGHSAGRVNQWVTRENSANYDIVSHYFTHETAKIRLFDDSGEIKSFDF